MVHRAGLVSAPKVEPHGLLCGRCHTRSRHTLSGGVHPPDLAAWLLPIVQPRLAQGSRPLLPVLRVLFTISACMATHLGITCSTLHPVPRKALLNRGLHVPQHFLFAPISHADELCPTCAGGTMIPDSRAEPETPASCWFLPSTVGLSTL